MGKIRLGIVGAGVAVRDLHLPALAQMTDAIDIAAVVSRSLDRAAAMSALFAQAGVAGVSTRATVSDLFEDPGIDAVLIAVPIDMTARHARAAILAGKHVLAEKPLAESVPEAVDVWMAAREHGVVLAVAENYRFQSDIATARRIVLDGRIGTPLMCIVNDLHSMRPDGKYTVTEWRRTGTHRGGYIVDAGTHPVAVMRELVGRNLQTVHGVQTSFHPEYLSRQSDTLLLNLTFDDNYVAQLSLGSGAIDIEARHPKVYGTEGTLALVPDAIEVWTRDGAARVAKRTDDKGFVGEWDAFVRSVRDGSGWESLVRESIIDLAVLTAGITSASERRVVDFPAYLRESGFPVD